jgi:hypothetical protein
MSWRYAAWRDSATRAPEKRAHEYLCFGETERSRDRKIDGSEEGGDERSHRHWMKSGRDIANRESGCGRNESGSKHSRQLTAAGADCANATGESRAQQ